LEGRSYNGDPRALQGEASSYFFLILMRSAQAKSGKTG